MAKGEIKTQRTRASVKEFVDGIEDEKRRVDCRRVLALMKDATGAKPEMWGPSIVGFGSYQYPSAGGKMNDWFLTGFAPRKAALTVYLMTGYKQYSNLMKKLGKHTVGGSCLYIKNLDDVDEKALKELIATGIRDLPKIMRK